MGTNYYAVNPKCDHCGHKPELLHIGKSSCGWTFSFHATKELRSWKEWKEYLKDREIEDECGEIILLSSLVETVLRKVNEKYSHAKSFPDDGRSFLDPEGHSFSEGEFS
jgi:hypothetical protein